MIEKSTMKIMLEYTHVYNKRCGYINLSHWFFINDYYSVLYSLKYTLHFRSGKSHQPLMSGQNNGLWMKAYDPKPHLSHHWINTIVQPKPLSSEQTILSISWIEKSENTPLFYIIFYDSSNFFKIDSFFKIVTFIS